MSEQSAVPLIVLSASRDPAEVVNGILRRAGHAVYCTWIPALPDLADALTQINPELLLLLAQGDDEIGSVARIRDQIAPAVPLIVIADAVDEMRMALAMQHGARDVVTLANPARLQAIMGRELRAHRIERTLDSTLRSARETRRQLEAVLQQSADAIAQVQEGIVVDANTSWLELFGFERAAIVGQPIMDVFDESTHAALKGALAACLQGRWSDHTLSANGYFADGSRRTIELRLTLGEHDGEPCVRLTVPVRQHADSKAGEQSAQTSRQDATTGMLQRLPLLEAVRERSKTPPAGARCVVVVRPDKFAAIEREVGIGASDDVLVELATLLKAHVSPNDLAGRLGGVAFLALIERDSAQEAETWCSQLIEGAAKLVVKAGEKSLSFTCSAGVAIAPAGVSPDAAIVEAIEACRKAQQRGGNDLAVSNRADADTRVQSYDAVWVKHIKSALLENRFRLVQQPIASLDGEDPGMTDVLVRMLDQNGKEVLPGEFLPAAERNDLLKNVDRWVVGASLSFAAQRKPGCLFVRLSKDTLKDASFLGWLDNQVRASRAEPVRIAFEVAEDVAASHLEAFQDLCCEVRERGFRCAVEHFGGGRDPQALLTAPLQFVKIDGRIVQSLASDPELQQRVRTLVQEAKRRKIETIAERVEDANTMAVLWQVGVQYIQGYFVHTPEEVVLRAER
ncbi:MAG TPA: EAL domain-containing protein [Steroidobacteraceae bacterium]|nr:EAL domain-containing protein [Steroidobacteraceae bacterium]